jgi:DNA-binding Lrp family transcriptional regulator
VRVPGLQRRILVALSGGSASSISELARRVQSPRPSVSRAVAALVESGLVTRSGREVALSAAGIGIAVRAEQHVTQDVNRRVQSVVSIVERNRQDLQVLSQSRSANEMMWNQLNAHVVIAGRAAEIVGQSAFVNEAALSQLNAHSMIANEAAELLRLSAVPNEVMSSPLNANALIADRAADVLGHSALANEAMLSQLSAHALIADQFAQMSANTALSEFANVQHAIHSLINVPTLPEIESQLTQMSALAARQEVFDELTKFTPALTDLINSPPWRELQEQNQGIAALMSAPGLSAVQDNINALTGSGWIDRIGEVWKYAHDIRVVSGDIDEMFREFRAQEESGAAFEFAGLVPSPHVAKHLRRKVQILLEDGRAAGTPNEDIRVAIHREVLAHYDENDCAAVKAITRRLTKHPNFAGRKTVIEQSFEAHRLHLDAISTYPLCSMIEGLIKEALSRVLPPEEKPGKLKHIQLPGKLQEFVNDGVPLVLADVLRLVTALARLYRYWNWDLGYKPSDQDSTLSRHALFHGFTRQGTRLDSIHCFLVLDLLAELFTFVEENRSSQAA